MTEPAVDLVMVEWEDSAQPVAAWCYLRDHDDWSPVKCVSVGWLIQRDDRVHALAPNMGEIEDPAHIQASGIIRIPTRAVTRVVRLREGEAISPSSSPSSRPDRARKRKPS